MAQAARPEPAEVGQAGVRDLDVLDLLDPAGHLDPLECRRVSTSDSSGSSTADLLQRLLTTPPKLGATSRSLGYWQRRAQPVPWDWGLATAQWLDCPRECLP